VAVEWKPNNDRQDEEEQERSVFIVTLSSIISNDPCTTPSSENE
jgi:hypothetical protein